MAHNYKKTLNMPQTSFSMKAGLVAKEPQYRKRWAQQKIYRKALAKNRHQKRFILHDGPPYANGDLHMGHALNKVLKDIIVRYKTMQGFYAPYSMGWDTHGMPIENKMLQNMNQKKEHFTPLELRIKAAKYALEQVANQKAEFAKLQMLTDGADYYVTLNRDYETKQLKFFKQLFFDDLIYKALKPVYWSPSSQSALAEAEVEYAQHTSPAIFVGLKVLTSNQFVAAGDQLVIWTTTPWTLIANAGVAVGHDFQYCLVAVQNQNYVIAKNLVPTVAKTCKWNDWAILKEFSGQDLVGLQYQRPVKKTQQAPVVLGHHVTLESGSGLVHLAPLFGEDDFRIGQAAKLEMIMHVGDDGTLNQAAGQYAGLFYENANKAIGEALATTGQLLSLRFLKHALPHDWRTNKPIIYRGSPQWFMSIKPLKKGILATLKTVKSYPEWGTSALAKMIENRDEWTISRQRSWGVPIIIFYDQNQKPVREEVVFDHVIALIAKAGSNIWFERTADQLLPPQYQNLGWTKETDIMDVWFDSGCSAIAFQPENESGPFEMYLEGKDQYRGWFNSSLINYYVYQKQAPFKTFISHGFVLDGKGNKMSKSKGNIISPLEIINRQGADILRLWVANVEFTSDVTISPQILQQNVEIYRKIRNTFRFMLGNLFDFKAAEAVPLTGIHALVAENLNNLKAQIITHYETYDLMKIVKEVNSFLIDLSAFYFEIHKDVLYAELANSQLRKQVQTNIDQIVKTLNIALAPILPTTSEEIYQEFPQAQESIHLENFFAKPKLQKTQQTLWADFFKINDLVNQAIEQAIKSEIIKRKNAAHVVIEKKLRTSFIATLNLKQLLMVGAVSFGETTKVTAFASYKCQRCWNHFALPAKPNQLCNRCEKVLQTQKGSV